MPVRKHLSVANVVFFIIRTAHFWATFRELLGFIRETKSFVECLCTRGGRGNKLALMSINDSDETKVIFFTSNRLSYIQGIFSKRVTG